MRAIYTCPQTSRQNWHTVNYVKYSHYAVMPTKGKNKLSRYDRSSQASLETRGTVNYDCQNKNFSSQVSLLQLSLLLNINPCLLKEQ